MKNTGLMIFGTLGAILLGFIPPLIVWCLSKEKLETGEKEVIKTILNFEISLLIVCLVASLIPFIGKLIVSVCSILNIVYAIMAYLAANDNKPLKPLTFYEFVK